MKVRALRFNGLLLVGLLLLGATQPALATLPVPSDRPVEGGPTISSHQTSDLGWTWQNPLPQGNTLNAVWGSSSKDVFAVGAGGTILNYDGMAWRQMESNTAAFLNGVWGSGPANVFVVGAVDYRGIILHYDGTAWRQMDCGSVDALKGVWGSGPDDVYAVGGNFWNPGVILHYNGSHWREISTGVSAALQGVWGDNAKDVYVVGDSGNIMHYNGNSWNTLDSGTQYNLYGVWGSSASQVFAIGMLGMILRYYGDSWTLVSESQGALYEIWGSSPNDVFAVGTGGLIMHYGGAAWGAMDSPTTDYMYGVWGTGPDDVFAVGEGGTILHYDGHAWSPMVRTVSEAYLNGVWGAGPDDVISVGSGGTVLHYDGTAWRTMGTRNEEHLTAVWGSDPHDVFAVGDSGAILRYNGDVWTEMNSGVSWDLRDVWGSSGNDVFAVGGTNGILHYDGNEWSVMAADIEQPLLGIWGSGANDVFAVGGGWSDPDGPSGVVLHYDGNTWSQMTSSVGDLLSDVWGSSGTNVFAVGGDAWATAWITSIIMHYDGNEWREISSGPENPLRGVGGTGPDDVFAAGAGGAILHYDGITWSQMNSGTINRLGAVWGSGPDNVFAVGGGGTILHYGERTEDGVVSGRVTSTVDDTGLSDVTLTARTYSTTTDVDGSYTLVVPPGVYTMKATPSAGMDYYANQRSFITVDNGETVTVDLKLTPITSDTVDTLVLANLQRMKDIGYDATAVDQLEMRLGQLKGTHPENTGMTAILADLGERIVPGVDAAYAAWKGNEGGVPETNALVDEIDQYIEDLKSNDYANLEYVVIVGSHEVIPMNARPADSKDEKAWAEEEGHLPAKEGYVYEIYTSPEAGTGGYYLTDAKYGDLSFVDDGETRGCDGELIPELYVGRLVETPEQIIGLVDTYLASAGLLSKEKLVAIASNDLVPSGRAAVKRMGPETDSELVQPCFTSDLVVQKMERAPDIVYLAGHSDYYRTGTCREDGEWTELLHAGPEAGQGSVRDIPIDLPNTVIASVGCHNGLNLGNQLYQAPDSESRWSDFPEEFSKKKVGVFLSSTGMAKRFQRKEGWRWLPRLAGDISHSEVLVTNFLHFLLHGNGTSAGEAFKAAVNSYVTGNEACEASQNQVLGIATVYGIPNYRLPSSGETEPVSQAAAVKSTAATSGATQDRWSLKLEIPSWQLADDGVITIPGASYTENPNKPRLPVISLRRLLPDGSTISSITWNHAESISQTMINDVPLPVIGTPTLDTGENLTETGTFTSAGDYPTVPYFSSDLSDIGGGRWLNVQVVPVQYNQSTHTTRIWTHLSFAVEYDLGDSNDSDDDGLPDYWEKAYGLDPANDSGDSGADADIDGDGLTNAEEYYHSTNPKRVDTDDDGVQDRTEIVLGTDPNNPFSKPHLIFLPIVTRDH